MLNLADAQTPIFSVYRTENAIEIHAGCEEAAFTRRLICTQNSYANAYEFCELLAQQVGLPIQDYTRKSSQSQRQEQNAATYAAKTDHK